MALYHVSYTKLSLQFKRPSGTSRGVLRNKDSWFVKISSSDDPKRIGIGECSLIKGLSVDDRPDFEEVLKKNCFEFAKTGQLNESMILDFPAMQFGFETALRDLNSEKERILYSSEFTRGEKHIPINGLIWMGDISFMKAQIKDKLDEGYSCLKLKIGSLDFDQELELLKSVRNSFSPDDLELRVDANGAFSPDQALAKLNRLQKFKLHSIEQPIKQGQIQQMAELCKVSPIPIALDEELIGVQDAMDRSALLKKIMPGYIIIKPSLLGGLKEAEKWIFEAEKKGIGWWITSALESNIGLNAIAQWTFSLKSEMLQGLGTGQIYTNNIPSPLYIKNGKLGYNHSGDWHLESLFT